MVVLQLLFLSRGHGRIMVLTRAQTKAIIAVDGLVCLRLPPPVTRRVERAPVVTCAEPVVDDRVPVLYVSSSPSSSSSSSVSSSSCSTVTPQLPPHKRWKQGALAPPLGWSLSSSLGRFGLPQPDQ